MNEFGIACLITKLAVHANKCCVIQIRKTERQEEINHSKRFRYINKCAWKYCRCSKGCRRLGFRGVCMQKQEQMAVSGLFSRVVLNC